MSGPDPNDPTTWGLSPEYLALFNRDLRALDSPAVFDRVQGIEGVMKNGRHDAVPKLVALLDDDAPVIGPDAAGEVRHVALVALQRLHWMAKKPLEIPPVQVRATWPLAEMREAYTSAIGRLPAAERDAVHARADDYLARRVMPSAHTAADARAYRVLQELGRIDYQRQEVDPVTLLTPLQEQLNAHQVSKAPPLPRVRVALRERPETTTGWIHVGPGQYGWTGTFSEHPARPDADALFLEALPAPGGVIRRVVHDEQGRPVLDPRGNLVIDGEISLESGDTIEILRCFAAFLGRRFATELQLAAAPPPDRVATLYDLTDAQLAEARALRGESGRLAAVRYLHRLVDGCNLGTAAEFVEDVIEGGADSRTWRRRDLICSPVGKARDLLTRPLSELRSVVDTVDGERWVRIRPRMGSWTSAQHEAAPGVLVRSAPYWWRGPAGTCTSLVSGAEVEAIDDLDLAGRRWIASQVASELRARPLPDTAAAIVEALGVDGPLSADGEIALAALLHERAIAPDDRPPGFRGPDAWYRARVEPGMVIVLPEQARARGLPPVDLRLDASESGLLPDPNAQREGFYLRLHRRFDSIELAAWPAADDERGAEGIERSLRRILDVRRPELVRVSGGLGSVQLAGGTRQAGCVYFPLPAPLPRLVTCVVLVEHAHGVVMVSFIHDVHRDRDVTPAEVLEHPRLRLLARSLRVS